MLKTLSECLFANSHVVRKLYLVQFVVNVRLQRMTELIRSPWFWQVKLNTAISLQLHITISFLEKVTAFNLVLLTNTIKLILLQLKLSRYDDQYPD